MYKTVDESGLNQSVQATVVIDGNTKLIRLRPHSPQTYFPSQGQSIVLTFDAIQALVSLAKRNGWRDNE